MEQYVYLEYIVRELYLEMSLLSEKPIKYCDFHRKVRDIFAENHDLHESALDDSVKILISEEDEPTEKVGIMIGLGLLPRNFYSNFRLGIWKEIEIKK